jgi:hypothetical protein
MLCMIGGSFSFRQEERELLARKGFLDLLFLETYHSNSFRNEEIEAIEAEILGHISIVLPLCKPDDRTLIPMLAKQETVVDENMKLQGGDENRLRHPFLRKEKLFL